MRRRDVLIGGGASAAAALSGCLSQATNPGSGGESSDGGSRTIAVSGSGEATGEPDLARFTASVEARGEDADTVRDELAARVDTLREELLSAGLEEDAITTSRMRIRSVAEERARESADGDEEREREVYYEGTHGLAVEVDDVDAVGEIIDAAIDGGADRISGLHFTLSAEAREDLREAALTDAINAAEAEVEHIAAEVDAEVVDVTHVDASRGRVSPVRETYDVADDAGGTEVFPDDVTVSASVDMIVEIE